MVSRRGIDRCESRKRRCQARDQDNPKLHGPISMCVLARIGLGSRTSSSVAAVRVTLTIPRSSGMLE